MDRRHREGRDQKRYGNRNMDDDDITDEPRTALDRFIKKKKEKKE